MYGQISMFKYNRQYDFRSLHISISMFRRTIFTKTLFKYQLLNSEVIFHYYTYIQSTIMPEGDVN